MSKIKLIAHFGDVTLPCDPITLTAFGQSSGTTLRVIAP